MKIWSIQSEKAWSVLEKTGHLVGTRRHGSKTFQKPYAWMRQQVLLRVGPPPKKNAMPLWGWFQWQDAERKKPDLRSVRHHWGPPGRYVLIECDLPDQNVVLSDYDMWHIPLNEGYIGKDDADDERFEEKLKKINAQHGLPWPPLLDKERTDSWVRVLDLTWGEEHGSHPLNKKSIQACFWEIRREQVKTFKLFQARVAKI
jgi:hypothetical protein